MGNWQSHIMTLRCSPQHEREEPIILFAKKEDEGKKTT